MVSKRPTKQRECVCVRILQVCLRLSTHRNFAVADSVSKATQYLLLVLLPGWLVYLNTYLPGLVCATNPPPQLAYPYVCICVWSLLQRLVLTRWTKNRPNPVEYSPNETTFFCEPRRDRTERGHNHELGYWALGECFAKDGIDLQMPDRWSVFSIWNANFA